jgi:ribosomal-protein-alanine N-acetyltransferase
MHLQTERLLVRDLTSTDLDSVHTILDIDLRMDNRTRQDRGRWLDWTILDYEQRQRVHQPPYGEYAVELTHTGEVVGLVGLVPSLMPFGLLPYYTTHLLGEPRAYNFPEVGLFWATATEHQRRGYASEAAAVLIAFGFATLKLTRIVATTEHDNAASIAVMRRLAMRIERNPLPAPFYLQVVGMIENLNGPPIWPAHP